MTVTATQSTMATTTSTTTTQTVTPTTTSGLPTAQQAPKLLLYSKQIKSNTSTANAKPEKAVFFTHTNNLQQQQQQQQSKMWTKQQFQQYLLKLCQVL